MNFLKNHINDLNSFLPLDKDKLLELLNYIENQFIISLSNTLAGSEKVNENLLNLAEDAIDDLKSIDLDFEDFNKRIKQN